MHSHPLKYALYEVFFLPLISKTMLIGEEEVEYLLNEYTKELCNSPSPSMEKSEEVSDR